jgi:hypothetical protein
MFAWVLKPLNSEMAISEHNRGKVSRSGEWSRDCGKGRFSGIVAGGMFAVRLAVCLSSPLRVRRKTAYHAKKALQYSNSLLDCDLRKVPACALGRISDAYKLLAETPYTQGS